MRKDETLAIFQREKKVQKLAGNSKFYRDNASRIIAQVVNFCFETETVAKFKDINVIADLVKNNFNDSVISDFKNTVVYNSTGDILVQYTKNDIEDTTKINTTMIRVKRNGEVQGESKKYVMKEYNYKAIANIDETFAESELSRCEISDMNSVDFNNLDKEEKKLYQRMEICSSLFIPVMKKMGIITMVEEAVERSSELEKMLNDEQQKNVSDSKRVSL